MTVTRGMIGGFLPRLCSVAGDREREREMGACDDGDVGGGDELVCCRGIQFLLRNFGGERNTDSRSLSLSLSCPFFEFLCLAFVSMQISLHSGCQ